MTTVLVVDDVAAQRTVAAALIERHLGWKVRYAVHGKDALEKLAADPADMVLTDLLMPEMDGLQLLRALRNDHPEVPVILMTASGSEDIAVQALQEGAASYVPKRALARRLAETLKSVLTASHAERGHAELDKRLVSQSFRFELENDVTLLLALPTYLRSCLAATGLGDHLHQLRTHVALEEALTNALYHGNLEIGSELSEKSADDFCRIESQRAEESPYRDRRIHFEAQLTPSQAQFAVRDEGPGFDTSTLPDANDPSSLDRPRGRGVMLMRTFMDEVRYNDKGNEVVMLKRFKGSRA